MIYLDNAATSWPKPEIVYQAMEKFLREKGGNPGHGSHSLATAAKQAIEEVRTLVARFINAPARERVIFTLNCTESINIGLKGLLKPGDHVITSSLEHNAVARPLWKLERQGVRVTRVPVSPLTGVTSAADIEAAITEKTRMIAMIHVSNVNGVIQPVAEYGRIARKHRLVLLVDAAQSAGHFPLMTGKNIDRLLSLLIKVRWALLDGCIIYQPKVNPILKKAVQARTRNMRTTGILRINMIRNADGVGSPVGSGLQFY